MLGWRVSSGNSSGTVLGSVLPSLSFQRHQKHEYVSVTFSGFKIIIKRFVATESGSGAGFELVNALWERCILRYGISPFPELSTCNMLGDNY